MIHPRWAVVPLLQPHCRGISVVLLGAATACGGSTEGDNASRGGASGTFGTLSEQGQNGGSSFVSGTKDFEVTQSSGGVSATDASSGKTAQGGVHNTSTQAISSVADGGLADSGAPSGGANSSTTLPPNAGGKVNIGGMVGTWTTGGMVGIGGSKNTLGSAGTGGALLCPAGGATSVLPTLCGSDSACPSGSFCDLENCGDSCSCQNGAYVCTNVCVHTCKAATCLTSTFTLNSVSGSRFCDMVLRIDAKATQILAYRLVCGTARSVSMDDAAAQLPVAGTLDWGNVTRYGDPSTGYLFVKETPAYRAVAVSGLTGQVLFSYIGEPGGFRVEGTWSSPETLDGSCNGRAPSFQTLGPWDASDSGEAIMKLVYGSGVLYAIARSNGAYDHVTLVRTNLPTPEYVAIITTSPRA